MRAVRGLKNDVLASCPRLLASPMGAGPTFLGGRGVKVFSERNHVVDDSHLFFLCDYRKNFGLSNHN